MAKNTTPPANTTPTYQLTREDWLRRAVDMFRPMIEQVSGIVVPDVHISVGLGSRRYEKGVEAVCYRRRASADGHNHIFISPEQGDTAEVLNSVLHELIHAALDCEDGHRGRFAEYATRLGFEAPFTMTPASVSLMAEFMVMAGELGEYPHAKLTITESKPATVPGGVVLVGTGGSITSAPGPQTNRWVSFYCPVHGDPIRMSRGKAAHGAPFCGHRDDNGVPCLTETIAK